MGVTIKPAIAAGIRGMVAEGVEWSAIERLMRMPRQEIEPAIASDQMHVAIDLRPRHREFLERVAELEHRTIGDLVSQAVREFYQRYRLELAKAEDQRKLAAGPAK